MLEAQLTQGRDKCPWANSSCIVKHVMSYPTIKLAIVKSTMFNSAARFTQKGHHFPLGKLKVNTGAGVPLLANHELHD